MSERPEALRLADCLEGNATTPWTREEAAAELRRLHTQRDELLEALRKMTERIEGHPAYETMTEEEENLTGGDTAELSYLARIGRAAIAKATGEQA